MAKSSTESTAVNQLIELVATQKPVPPDPSDDLMFKVPPPVPARATRSVSTPRMSTAPTRAGEVPPLPRARAPHGTQQNQVPPLPPAVRVSTAPPARAASIPPLPPLARKHPSDAELTNPGLRAAPPRPSAPAPRPSLSSTSSFEYPVTAADSAAITAPAGATKPAFAPSHAADMTGHAPWFEASAPMPRVEQSDIGTQMVQRPANYAAIVGKLIGPMVILVVVGIFIGGYFAFDGDGGKPRTPKPAAAGGTPIQTAASAAPSEAPTPTEVAPSETPTPTEVAPAAADHFEPVQAAPAMPDVAPAAAAAAVAPAPAPAPAEPAAVTPPNLAPTAPAPTMVDVRIDSKPAGATVVLVDRGKTTFLGTTPMSASLDPSRKYELVFTAEQRATTVEAIDPSKTTRVDVALARERRRRAAARPADAVTRPALVEPTFDTALAAPKPAPPKAMGEGVLMISSKPPCEIVIDGKPTGLMTPQRAIKLPAGAHKVTLINASAGIQKTLGVQITANKPTKLIQDFMK